MRYHAHQIIKNEDAGCKLRILIISDEFIQKSCGGAGVYISELSKALSRFNLELHLLVPSSKNIDTIKNNFYFHEVHVSNKMGFKALSWRNKMPKKIKNIIKEYNINILHYNTLNCAMIKEKLPIITTIHHPIMAEFFDINFIEKIFGLLNVYFEMILLKKSNRIISVSPMTKKLLLEQNYKLKNRIFLISEGVDTDRFKPRDFKIKKIYNIKKNELVLFFPGGVRAKRKGAETAFKAFKKLKSNNVEFKCIISGKNREFGWDEELKLLISKYKLSDNLILVGELDYNDLPKYYSASDIVIFPSLFEGFGIPILESMSCGKALIASRTGAAEDIIKDGEDGLLFKVGDYLNLFKKIKLLVENNNKRIEIGENARKKALQYSWDKIANEYLKVYEEVLNEYNKKQKKK